MTNPKIARARHRADVPATTFLSNSRLSAFALRGTLGVATAGLAFGLVAPGASAYAGEPSPDQGGGSASASAGVGTTGGGTSEGATTVTVSAGDTVGEIAADQGSSVSDIIEANDLGANALIFVGDELTIPGGSGSSSESSSSSVDGAGAAGGGGQVGSSGSSASNDILDVARQYIGTPYVWGGSSPSGFDCSGFTQYVFAQLGIDIPRTTDAQRGAGQVVSASEAQPGDLVWWPGHVGIYTGDGQHIAARNPGTPLEEGPIWNDSPTFIRVA